MSNLHIIDNPLIKRDITYLRDKNTKEYQFRLALKRISFILAAEIGKELSTNEIEVETPLEKTTGHRINQQIVLIPVLRAGLSMVSAFIEMIPHAKVGHIGMERDEETLKARTYYFKTPKNLDKSKVIVLDPMLATGGSAVAVFNYLKKNGANDSVFACLIAAPEGIARLNAEHPEIPIYTAVKDRQLNEKGYILPGLGDAGDRTFGTL